MQTSRPGDRSPPPPAGRARPGRSRPTRRRSDGAHVGGVDHRRGLRFFRRLAAMAWARSKASAGDRLVVLVVADHPAAAVGRDDLGRREPFARREGRLARAGGADQQHQREVGDVEEGQGPSSDEIPSHLRHRPVLEDHRCRCPTSVARVAVFRPRSSADPTGESAARVHSKRWSGWRRLAGRPASGRARCGRRWASSPPRYAGPRGAEHHVGQGRQAVFGSRCSITSTRAAASTPCQRASRR